MAELKFYCRVCGKKLDIFEAYHLPGEDIFDEFSGISYNSGSNYCKKCYEARLGQNQEVSEHELLGLGELNKIKDLKAGGTDINLIVEVIDKNETKVKKEGKQLRLGRFKIKDDTGENELVLWERIIDLVRKGDKLLLKKCYIRTFKDQKQVTLGKKGRIVNLDASKF